MNTDLAWVLGSLSPVIVGLGVPLLGHLIITFVKRLRKEMIKNALRKT